MNKINRKLTVLIGQKHLYIWWKLKES